jgi:hypothetical protein
MTNEEQRAILATFIESLKQTLLERAARWPDDWDGHELRELAADAFDRERTRLLSESRRRRRDYHNACIVDNLF